MMFSTSCFTRRLLKKLARYAQMHYLNFSGKIHLVIARWGKFLIGLGIHINIFLWEWGLRMKKAVCVRFCSLNKLYLN